MPTIEDVARAAGVSIATVSRILHNSPKVLPETRQRVMEAIEQLDYHPNQLARQFRTQRTKTVLVLVPELGNTFYSDILPGIESVAEDNGYHILIGATHNQAGTEEYFFECLKQKQVDGIITFSAVIPQKKLEALASQFPVVVAVRYYEGMGLPSVAIDNAKAVRDITSYLLSLGHRQVCYLAGDTDIMVYQYRLNGYLGAMKARGLAEIVCECDASIQGGYAAVKRLLSTNTKFTGVVACGDTAAIGAIQALRDSSLDVPGDVAVTGFDDIELSSLYSPSLTTVRQPKRQIGMRSMEILLDLIAGKTPANQQDVLSYELVIRESTGEYVG